MAHRGSAVYGFKDAGDLVDALQESFENGTAALPAIAFDSDPDTGIFRSAANVLGLAAGGVLSAIFVTASSAVNRLSFTPSAAGASVTVGAAGSDTNITTAVAGKGSGGVSAELIGGEITFGAGTATISAADAAVKVTATTTAKGDAVGLTIGTDNTLTSLLTTTQLCRVYGRFDVDIASGTDSVVLIINVGGASAFETASQSIASSTPVQFEIDVLLNIDSGEAIELYAENEDAVVNVTVAAASEALNEVPAHGFLRVTAA